MFLLNAVCVSWHTNDFLLKCEGVLKGALITAVNPLDDFVKKLFAMVIEASLQD